MENRIHEVVSGLRTPKGVLVAELRKRILAQAGDDFIELTWESGRAMVPRAPFVVWAFAKLGWFKDMLPAWKPISPVGMKLLSYDDPVHTDWVIGAGFDPQDKGLYFGPLALAIQDLHAKIQDEFDTRIHLNACGQTITTLVTGARVTGVVIHGQPGVIPPKGMVVVVPNLHSRYLWAVTGAAAVICEVGGEVAHLAQVSRAQAVPVVRANKALEHYKEGDVVEVDPEARTVRTVSQS